VKRSTAKKAVFSDQAKKGLKKGIEKTKTLHKGPPPPFIQKTHVFFQNVSSPP
jgi:hypothetical protein